MRRRMEEGTINFYKSGGKCQFQVGKGGTVKKNVVEGGPQFILIRSYSQYLRCCDFTDTGAVNYKTFQH